MRSRMFGMLVVGCLALACVDAPGDRPRDGEARIRYLGHAGWLVRTSEHDLVFDYTGPVETGALDRGALSAESFTERPVLLFVSHAHGDHFRDTVFALRDAVERSVVVLGWDEPGTGPVVVPADATWTDVSGAAVFALHHEFDGIPEGFFLVRSGGLTIYHSGDHGTWSDPPVAPYTSNIDQLATAAGQIDIAFLSAFGTGGGSALLNAGDVYGIETLAPRVTFPMHRGGREEDYAAFAAAARARDLPTTLGVATAPGTLFRYENGTLHERP